jgi:hypothetical protein
MKKILLAIAATAAFHVPISSAQTLQSSVQSQFSGIENMYPGSS